jgi:hypothetical protein
LVACCPIPRAENALAFQEIAAAFREIEALKDKLANENAYLEEEVRTGHNRWGPGRPGGRRRPPGDETVHAV